MSRISAKIKVKSAHFWALICLGGGWGTTRNMIFSFTYYLELCNPIIVYCTSHFLPTKAEFSFYVTVFSCPRGPASPRRGRVFLFCGIHFGVGWVCLLSQKKKRKKGQIDCLNIIEH